MNDLPWCYVLSYHHLHYTMYKATSYKGTRPRILLFTICYVPSAMVVKYAMFLKNAAKGVPLWSYILTGPHIALDCLGEARYAYWELWFLEPNVSRRSRYNSSYFTYHSPNHPESLGYTSTFLRQVAHALCFISSKICLSFFKWKCQKP